MISERTDTKNAYGQIFVKGKMLLRHPIEMRNSANDGRDILSKMIQPTTMTIPAGVEVEFTAQETRSGWYQNVILRCEKGIFYNTVRTETFEGKEYK
jgi:hypothetical protein